VPGLVTEITEIATALGTLSPDLPIGLGRRPAELANVDAVVWDRLRRAYDAGDHAESFATAFSNGVALLRAEDGLRWRRPRTVEWKGPHRPPGDDVIPADLRIDHVYLVSCKYLSKVLLNVGPARLFDRLLVGEDRATAGWFGVAAPAEFAQFYEASCRTVGIPGLPAHAADLTVDQQQALRRSLSARVLPEELQPMWSALCVRVSAVSAERWAAALTSHRAKLRMLWRLLRISNATYFVLGADRSAFLRLRVASSWDWHHAFRLRSLVIRPRDVGQPEVGWVAHVEHRTSGRPRTITGHVEIRWSHGRFVGWPEAKVYLDTPHAEVAGYEALR
jgi:hypothetical protein